MRPGPGLLSAWDDRSTLVMKAYVATTGIVFALLTLAHLWRVAAEGRHLLTNPWWDGITISAASFAIWAWRLLRLRQRT